MPGLSGWLLVLSVCGHRGGGSEILPWDSFRQLSGQKGAGFTDHVLLSSHDWHHVTKCVAYEKWGHNKGF